MVTWGLVAELAVFFWRPNYEIDMYECADAFEFRNQFEGAVAALGEPIATDASVDEQADRRFRLINGTLVCAIGAALGEKIADPEDHFIGMHVPTWIERFNEGLDVADERLKQLAPDGLPIWQD